MVGDGWETVVLLCLHSACVALRKRRVGGEEGEQEATLGRGNGHGHSSRPTGKPSPWPRAAQLITVSPELVGMRPLREHSHGQGWLRGAKLS